MNRLKDKVAVITGSTSGIGLGIARVYAAEGAKVVISGYQVKKRRKQMILDEIRKKGVDVFFHEIDLDDPSSIESLIAETAERYGKIDILVNNAGITRDNLLMKMTEEDFSAVRCKFH